jgi:DNA-directed RNA polymerase specialized sigma24 family protein
MYERVLAGLAPDEAEVLRLSESGLGPTEIARRQGGTALAARQRLFRARCAAAAVWQRLFPGVAAELAALRVFPPGAVAAP